MNLPISELLLPTLSAKERRPFEKQVAIEIFVAELQVALMAEASQATGDLGGAAIKATAHHYLALALRHLQNDEWRCFLAKEATRRRTASQKLAEKVLGWLSMEEGSPVAKALVQAWASAKDRWERAKQGPFPLQKDELYTQSREAALREFLVQALGRLAV